MQNIIKRSDCPACNSNSIHPVLEAEDFTVSHEKFSVWQCDNCTLRFTQNVPAENAIGRYYQSSDYVSHSDTKSGLINRLYHIVRNYTLQTKRKLVQKVTGIEKGSLLDIGAGTGAFAFTMQQAGWQVKGLEPDAIARQNALSNHHIQLESLDALPSLNTNTFDAITLWHVLEHVHELHNYLQTFNRILKDNGTLIIAVPNYTSYDADAYKEFWAAYDVPRHLYHFSPKSMQLLMQQHGFTVAAHKPMWFDSFYVSMLSEKYKTGKNNLVKAVSTGMQSNRKAMSDVTKCSSVIYVIKKKK